MENSISRLRTALAIIVHPENEWVRMEEEETARINLQRYGITCIVISHALLLLWIFVYALNRVPSSHSSYGPLYWSVAIFFRFALNLACLFVLPPLIAELAPSFRGTRDSLNALKLYVFALTPAWVGMIFGWFGILSGSIYSIYLLWKYAGDALAIPPLKKVSFVVTICFLLMILQWALYAVALPLAQMVL
jgi:hypothetical protein